MIAIPLTVDMERGYGADAGRVGAIPPLHVHRQGDGDHPRDGGHRRQQPVQGQGVAVRVAMAPGHPGAGGGHGRGAQAFDQAGAARVPGVGEFQQSGTPVQGVESSGGIGLWRHGISR